MKAVQAAQIEQAKKDVQSGRVQRVAVPGQWRVFKDENGEVVVETFEEASARDTGRDPVADVLKESRGALGADHDLDV